MQQSSLPLVALIGRPNVGKSTLFNRLVRGRRALTHDRPGVTRDRMYGTARRAGASFEVVDTGGVSLDESGGADQGPQGLRGFEAEVLAQAREAMAEARVIALVVDGREGLTPLDERLARFVRQSGKPVLLVVNKVDGGEQEDLLLSDFYALGLELMAVSAEHGYRLDELTLELERMLEEQRQAQSGPDEPDEPDEQDEQDRPLSLAMLGRPNAGKSSLVNALVGRERMIVSEIAGTTRDSVDVTIEVPLPADAARDLADLTSEPESGAAKRTSKGGKKGAAAPEFDEGSESLAEELALESALDEAAALATAMHHDLPAHLDVATPEESAPLEPDDSDDAESGTVLKRFTFVDTAGVRRRTRITDPVERFSVQAALASSRRADVTFYVIDALEGVTAQDKKLIAYLDREKIPFILLVNKVDLVARKERPNMERDYRDALRICPHVPVLFVSALTGTRLRELLPLARELWAECGVRVSTGRLNRIMQEALDRHQPPVVKRRRARFYYLTQADTRPPTFVFFVNDPERVMPSYQRYLENQLRRLLGIRYAPLSVHFRVSGKRWGSG